MHERIRIERGRDHEDEARREQKRRPRPVVVARPLVVGPADDRYEREADRLADLVAGPAIAPPAILASTERATRIRRRPVVGAEGGALDTDTEHAVRSAQTGGSAIAPEVQQQLGAALGADVSAVRLHADRRASELNHQMQASAFTIGRDVFFRDGLPDTTTAAGMHLLAHEVAHTVQQGRSPVRRDVVRRKLIPKAASAFQSAEAANPTFATGRQDTDDLAAEADQEDLSRVHGRMHTGQDSADEQKVARFVRAVVLTQYSARLRALETAKDDSGQPSPPGRRPPRRRCTRRRPTSSARGTSRSSGRARRRRRPRAS
jgi:hypothetical protein